MWQELSAEIKKGLEIHSGGKHEPGAGAGAGGRVNEMECLAIEREGKNMIIKSVNLETVCGITSCAAGK